MFTYEEEYIVVVVFEQVSENKTTLYSLEVRKLVKITFPVCGILQFRSVYLYFSTF